MLFFLALRIIMKITAALHFNIELEADNKSILNYTFN